MKRATWLILMTLFILLSACALSTKQSTPTPKNAFTPANTLAAGEYPEWITSLIASYEQDSVGNPPQSIWQYIYNGQTVYYVPPQCCDQYSTLYDANGDLICAPDGGLTGKGDGKCTDFFQERKNEKLIWNDPRTR
jgi:hypothetical protein